MFIAGTGQEIISPEQLNQFKPEVVIVMNRVYILEVTETLTCIEVFPELFSS